MIEGFCEEPFWDINQTWNCINPEFSSCFEDTVLVSSPCIFFSIVLLLHLSLLRKPASHNPLPWTWLNITKVLLSASLWCISCIKCGVFLHEKFNGVFVSHSSVLSACSQFLVFLLVTVSMLKHRSHGVITSSVLSTFWLIFMLCCVFMYRSLFTKHFAMSSSPISEVVFILDMIIYPIVFIEFILSLFVDKKNFTLLQETKIMDDVSLIARITYVWFIKFVHLGKKKLLTVGDLYYPSIYLTATSTYSALEKHWNKYLTAEIDDRSLIWALVKAFWPWVGGTLLLNFIFVFTLLVPPLLLDRLINFVEDDFFTWRGYFYAVLLFLVDSLGKLLANNSIDMMCFTTTQFQTSLMSALFRKNLYMSNSSRKDYASGVIMSLLTVDVKRLQWFSIQFATAITSPLKMIIILYILWQYIGISALAGVAIMGISFPISYFSSKLGLKYNDNQMEVKDARLKLMNEILSGIKILKLYAWETPFADRLTKTRKEEIKWILYNFFTYIVTCFTYYCAPIAISVATFATYLLMDPNHVLDPTKAFVTVTLMEQLKYALFELPDAIADLLQFNVSLRRLRNFFKLENKSFTAVGNIPDKGEVLTLRDVSFSWAHDSEYALTGINLNVPVGKLIAVIGPVGAGKSSLLSAILGELHKREGSIDLKGSVAYVPQQPWVLNRSLKRNILLVRHMNEDKYNKVLDLCCLRPDLEILPGGDETEIGEKGINLSGGQKLRVSLAQAVYQDRDIYLLDDPLSAVDVHVRKALFEDVIGNTGLLRKKTRILVTHDVSVLQNVDSIVSMKDGKIVEIGTYDELIEKQESFARFIEEHLNVKTKENDRRPNFERLESTLSKKSCDSHASGDQKIDKEKIENNTEHRQTDDETMEIGGVNRSIYLHYVKQMGPCLFLMGVLWLTLYTAFQAGANLWLTAWTAHPSANTTSTTMRLAVYSGLGLAQGVSVVIAYFFFMYGVTRASARYHKSMLDSVMKSPMSFFGSTPLGRIVNRFSTDLEIVDNQLFYRIDGWLSCILATIASFLIIGISTPVFLATLLPLGALYYYIQTLHLNTFRQLKRLESTGRSPVYSLFMESIQGVSSISAYDVKKDFIEEFQQKLDNCFICSYNSFVCNRWLTFNLDILGSIVVLIATVLAIYNRNLLNPATVGLIVTYALTVTDSLKWFVRMNSELEDKSISIERLAEYCNLESEAPWDVPHPDLREDWPQNGCVLFEDYSTRYREDLDLVLRELNLSINQCEKVGIIGRTGAGKSSITLSLFRVLEATAGKISIDDINISEIGLHNLRSKLTIIPQDPVLFTGPLRMNLDPNDEYTDDAIWESLEQSHLKTFVSGLSEGLAYTIDEGGSNISAGQRQLVCLARALLKKSKILVLDEATANVDMDTDSLIQNTIRTAFAHHTVITIAHRINTVLDYDKIVVMENGQVIEVGHPTNLLENQNSRFHMMSKEAGII